MLCKLPCANTVSWLLRTNTHTTHTHSGDADHNNCVWSVSTWHHYISSFFNLCNERTEGLKKLNIVCVQVCPHATTQECSIWPHLLRLHRERHVELPHNHQSQRKNIIRGTAWTVLWFRVQAAAFSSCKDMICSPEATIFFLNSLRAAGAHLHSYPTLYNSVYSSPLFLKNSFAQKCNQLCVEQKAGVWSYSCKERRSRDWGWCGRGDVGGGVGGEVLCFSHLFHLSWKKNK